MANGWHWLRSLTAGFVGSWRTTYLNFRAMTRRSPRSSGSSPATSGPMARTLSLCCGNLGEPGC